MRRRLAGEPGRNRICGMPVEDLPSLAKSCEQSPFVNGSRIVFAQDRFSDSLRRTAFCAFDITSSRLYQYAFTITGCRAVHAAAGMQYLESQRVVHRTYSAVFGDEALRRSVVGRFAVL